MSETMRVFGFSLICASGGSDRLPALACRETSADNSADQGAHLWAMINPKARKPQKSVSKA